MLYWSRTLLPGGGHYCQLVSLCLFSRLWRAFGNKYVCYCEQAKYLTGIAWGLVQVRSTPQNSLSEQRDKGEVKWETGTEMDEDYAKVMLSVTDICSETSEVWKWNCWLCLVSSLRGSMLRSEGRACFWTFSLLDPSHFISADYFPKLLHTIWSRI